MKALRRHHKERVINNRARLMKNRWVIDWYKEEGEEYCYNYLAKTGTPCSCWMCGNPRKYHKQTGEHKLTIQERKQHQESISQRILNG